MLNKAMSQGVVEFVLNTQVDAPRYCSSRKLISFAYKLRDNICQNACTLELMGCVHQYFNVFAVKQRRHLHWNVPCEILGWILGENIILRWLGTIEYISSKSVAIKPLISYLSKRRSWFVLFIKVTWSTFTFLFLHHCQRVAWKTQNQR